MNFLTAVIACMGVYSVLSFVKFFATVSGAEHAQAHSHFWRGIYLAAGTYLSIAIYMGY